MDGHFKYPLIAVAGMVIGLWGCAQDGGGQSNLAAKSQQATPVSEKTPDTLPTPRGPKKRVAVAGFGAHGKFTSRYGGWDIGGGLAAQLTTALVNSDRFLVVERPRMSKVLREQEISAKGLTSPGTAVKAGKLTGAQLLVRGEVTEFGQTSGGGVEVGAGGIVEDLGGAVGLDRTIAKVALDVRLIDATTGEVVQSRRVTGKTSDTGVAAEISTDEVSFGGDAFQKTLLGKATRQAIDKAVRVIAAEMQDVTWRARVAKVDGQRVYINAGGDAGLQTGDQLVSLRVVDRITDPVTNKVLGTETQQIASLEIAEVAEEYAIARLRSASVTPRRGDLVELQKGSLQ